MTNQRIRNRESRGEKLGRIYVDPYLLLTYKARHRVMCLSHKFQKHQRLLPTNLYVILYNFKSRHSDELDLKAGYKVTVIDTSDPDWWKGKCLGKIGYFPSKYCTKLQAGERPLQVTHNLQVNTV